MTAADVTLSEVGTGIVAPPARRRGRQEALARQPVVLAGLVVLALLVFVALFPGVVAPYHPNEANLLTVRQHPSAHHWFGTDQLGRDIFSRVVYGARITLVVGVLATLLGAVVGGLIGLAAGSVGGLVDSLLMRFSDILLAFPGILLALAIVAAAGPNERDLILAVGIATIPAYAKLMRSQVRSLKERAFVEASRASGSRRRTIVFGHLLPNAYSPLVGFATLGIGISVLTASSLSYLGLGPAPPSPEWGAMVSDGSGQIATSWWMALFPGLAILVSVLAISVVGQWLRQRFDIRSGE